MSKRLEKLADDMINLTPEESQKLALIVRAKLMPETVSYTHLTLPTNREV